MHGCMLGTLLHIRTNKDRERKTLFSLHLKALGALHPLMLDKLRARLARRPTSQGPYAMAYFVYALIRP
jgi:hypothetical protein